jgi:hypothetical protein
LISVEARAPGGSIGLPRESVRTIISGSIRNLIVPEGVMSNVPSSSFTEMLPSIAPM